MKKGIWLVMLLSLCMNVGLYAQKANKKETKKEKIARMEQEIATLQHQKDSLHSVVNSKDAQIEQLTNKQDSLVFENGKLTGEKQVMSGQVEQLQAQMQQIEEKVKEQQNTEAQAKKQKQEEAMYIKNKKYYGGNSREYCEKYYTCRTWALNMAKELGQSFKILGVDFDYERTRYGRTDMEQSISTLVITYLVHQQQHKRTMVKGVVAGGSMYDYEKFID